MTQAGAESVTNPDTGALPEVVHVTEAGRRHAQPGVHPGALGTTVLTFPADYSSLFGLMRKVYTNYSAVAGY